MTIIEKAIKLFDLYNDDFDSLLPFYLKHCYVISSPTIFVMAKRLDSIFDVEDDFSFSENGEVLFVQCAVGNLKELCLLIPKDIEYICFCRRGGSKLKIYNIDKFLKKINT